VDVLLPTFSTFVVATGAVLLLHQVLATRLPVSRRMREQLRVMEAAVTRERRPDTEAGPIGRLLAAIGRLGSDRGHSSLARRMSVAGIRGAKAALCFVGARIVVSLGPGLFVLVAQVGSGKPLVRALGMAALVGGLGHFGVNAWLRRKGQARVRQITAALPDTLDLMVVCLEAGLGLSSTIGRVNEERAQAKDPLSKELIQVAAETRGGRPRDEALRALAERNGVDDLKGLVGLMIQSERLGTSMAKTLRSHADLLRLKRRQRAEEAARKLPIKVLFPLAFFILPTLFVVTMGPALMNIGTLAQLIHHG
jgi:tight adherence protein C